MVARPRPLSRPHFAAGRSIHKEQERPTRSTVACRTGAAQTLTTPTQRTQVDSQCVWATCEKDILHPSTHMQRLKTAFDIPNSTPGCADGHGSTRRAKPRSAREERVPTIFCCQPCLRIRICCIFTSFFCHAHYTVVLDAKLPMHVALHVTQGTGTAIVMSA